MARVTAYNVLGKGYTSILSTAMVYVNVLPYKPSSMPFRGDATSSS